MHPDKNSFPRAAYRIEETCETLSISRTKLYEEIAAGRLRALKCGRRTLIPASEITAWLNSLSAKAA
jgi:excisionase family DNA binding protein